MANSKRAQGTFVIMDHKIQSEFCARIVAFGIWHARERVIILFLFLFLMANHKRHQQVVNCIGSRCGTNADWATHMRSTHPV